MLKAMNARESNGKGQRSGWRTERLEMRKEAAQKVEDRVKETPYLLFEHWTRIHTNNAMERLTGRLVAVPVLWELSPDGSSSALVLACARLRHVADTQWGNKNYMKMKHLQANIDDDSLAS